MKILFLEWASFANQYMIAALEKKGYEVIRFPFARDVEDTRRGEKLTVAIAEELLRGQYDYVFSFNYFPVAAMACKACRVIYVSWVYDSPFIQLYSETVKYETNRVYLFDSAEYARFVEMGIKTVRFLPMAADPGHNMRVIQASSDKSKYVCDIAFTGSTYSEEHQHMFRHLKELDEYTRGYLEGLMSAQKNVYGVNFLERLLTPQIIDNMRKVCPVTENGDGFETVEWTFATYFLDRKITAMERSEILALLSERYYLNLYTPEPTPLLKKVHNCGKVDYYMEAPLAFSRAKINLNITLKSIVNGIPLRAMDIMGSRGFLLTNYQADFMEFFVPGEDFVYYESYEDLLEKTEYYLSHEKERLEIAENGYRKICENHTYDNRIDVMFQ
ncbi:MAG: hypothetical protein E7294_09225 [Lachnospiraceae bacterium]|jgi:spore maturation protein CgeB|nr:hypothetical protein [Lachnospiraceae bacterium]